MREKLKEYYSQINLKTIKMKNIITLSGIILIIGAIACRKDNPLDEYSQYGYFKDAVILNDSITVDLKKGDSLAIETNKGKMWVKLTHLFVNCYKGSNNVSCPDFGMGANFDLRIGSENLKLLYSLDSYPSNNVNIKPNIRNCEDIYLTLLNDSYNVFRTLGKMSIQFRNIYPNPVTKNEHEMLLANNGYHATLTFIKRCD